MFTLNVAINTVVFVDYFVITPSSQYLSWDQGKFINESSESMGKNCDDGFSYNSSTNKYFLKVDELRELLNFQNKRNQGSVLSVCIKK